MTDIMKYSLLPVYSGEQRDYISYREYTLIVKKVCGRPGHFNE